jgi:hypothetical protein
MLRLLKKHRVFIAIFGIVFLFGNFLFGQEKKFFNKPVKFFGEYQTNEGCHGCEETADTDINKNAQSKEEPEKDIKLFVFIAPESSLSADAVWQAKTFGRIHPEVEVKGIIISPIEGLKEALLKNTSIFDKTFPFDYQPGLDIAQEYKITEVPSYVFVNKNKIIKVSGQPDLIEVYNKNFHLFLQQ